MSITKNMPKMTSARPTKRPEGSRFTEATPVRNRRHRIERQQDHIGTVGAVRPKRRRREEERQSPADRPDEQDHQPSFCIELGPSGRKITHEPYAQQRSGAGAHRDGAHHDRWIFVEIRRRTPRQASAAHRCGDHQGVAVPARREPLIAGNAADRNSSADEFKRHRRGAARSSPRCPTVPPGSASRRACKRARWSRPTRW